jgi:hypothetical protein
MAKQTATGIDGSVTFISGHAAKFAAFEFTEGQRLVDTTGFGDTHETFEGGIQFSSFRVDGIPQFDDTATSPGFGAMSGTPAAMTLQFAAGCTVAFSGVIESISGSSTAVNDARLMFTGRGSGDITEAWDEGV